MDMLDSEMVLNKEKAVDSKTKGRKPGSIRDLHG